MIQIKFHGVFGKRYRQVESYWYESHVETVVKGEKVFTEIPVGLAIQTKDGYVHFEPNIAQRPWTLIGRESNAAANSEP